jgi:formylglycine-generating enzyme required for sulfatase activity
MNSIRLILGVFTILVLQGCEKTVESTELTFTKVSQAELRQFIQVVKGNLVFVEGGDFLMGDFGPQYAPERLPYDQDQDSKPLHKVELSNFSINKLKVTNAEYQFYLKHNGLKLREKGMANKMKWDDINTTHNTPAHMDWYEAEQYCNWLASVIELPFALPTEAQWEYAARSRGQFLMVATDDGTYKAEPYSRITESYEPKGINISSSGNRIDFANKMELKTKYYTPLPVKMFPPNPLGAIFDVG